MGGSEFAKYECQEVLSAAPEGGGRASSLCDDNKRQIALSIRISIS